MKKKDTHFYQLRYLWVSFFLSFFLLLSMHPRRVEIINHCAWEIDHFLAEAEAF